MTGWLVQLIAIMAVIAFVGYEVISIAVTSINLEDDARHVAVAARDAYLRGGLGQAEEAAQATAGARGVSLVQVEVDDQSVFATVTKRADTVVVHRIGPLEDLTTPTAQGRVRWRQ